MPIPIYSSKYSASLLDKRTLRKREALSFKSLLYLKRDNYCLYLRRHMNVYVCPEVSHLASPSHSSWEIVVLRARFAVSEYVSIPWEEILVDFASKLITIRLLPCLDSLVLWPNEGSERTFRVWRSWREKSFRTSVTSQDFSKHIRSLSLFFGCKMPS